MVATVIGEIMESVPNHVEEDSKADTERVPTPHLNTEERTAAVWVPTSNKGNAIQRIVRVRRRKKPFSLIFEFILGDHILYSHDFSDCEGVDIIKRSLTMITIMA